MGGPERLELEADQGAQRKATGGVGRSCKGAQREEEREGAVFLAKAP